MTLKNSKGKVFYGMHFYPGVAEYVGEEGAFRVFLNESTIRSMGPTFEGRPVFVFHVDEVEEDINELRKEADGWVIESFFNEADGKHWAKFIVCSEKAEKAIKAGYRLSNCYLPKTTTKGGVWNGVSYQKEITSGEYEHLAIVPNPRYEESVIMTPEEFKAYNESKRVELIKLANNENPKKEEKMKLKLFKREKVENSVDIENLSVLLPKSNKEVTITQLVNAADEMEVAKGKPRLVNDADYVEVDGEKITVAELVKAFNAKSEEPEEVEDEEKVENAEDDEDKCENEDDMEEDDSMENEEDEEKADEKKEKKENKAKKKKNSSEEAKEKAKRLRNANSRAFEDEVSEYSPLAGVERGKSRYGY